MSPSEGLADRLAAATVALCAIPSVTGDERACADHVEATLRRLPLRVERVGESVVARTPPRGRPLVLLVGHLDTVPPKPGDAPAHRDGDVVVGLGASDMKGGLAVMLALADAVVPRASVDVGLVFYDSEEGPWDASGLAPVLDRVPWLHDAALAVCLEPTDNVVQVGCLGTLHARVVFRGRAAHSARPWQGDNAIHKAGRFLASLAALPPRPVRVGPFEFVEVLSATLASGGRTRNVVPDHFEVNVNGRFAPGRRGEDMIAELRALVPEAEVEVVEIAPSGPVVLDNAVLTTFVARTGVTVAAKQAWTDVARLGAAGIDAVNFGPGSTAQAHQAGEHVPVAALVQGYHLLAALLGAPS